MQIINPRSKLPLFAEKDWLFDADGNRFPIVRSVPRIADLDNYAESFGVQWNRFSSTQLDRGNIHQSAIRFFAETGWESASLDGENILEVGSGAGRFSKVVLEHTNASLWSVDYSDAVTANWESNGQIAPDRFHLYQASIYEMPFAPNSFDKAFCLGVLQHTPDFSASICALIDKVKPGGEIVVDFYPIEGWYTKVHAKYLLRSFTKRLGHQKLLSLIETNIDVLLFLYFGFYKLGLGALTRFLPICDINRTFPAGLSRAQIREWAVLDTFDMFSPEFDQPQRIPSVVSMFETHGATVTFAGYVTYGNARAAVVRGTKVQ